MKIDIESRCVYCGELESEAHMSCCGERHFEEVEVCQECGDTVDTVRCDTAGIETYQHRCQSCDWHGEPE